MMLARTPLLIAMRGELVLLRRSPAVISAILIIGLLSAFAGWRGGAFADHQRTAIAEAAAREAESDAEWRAVAARLERGEVKLPWFKSPLSAQNLSYSFVRHVTLPPKPLAAVSVGRADIDPYLFRINPHPADRWANVREARTPALAAYGGFDLSGLLILLTPLLVLLLLYDPLADLAGGERHRLGIVQAARERRLLAARFFPRAAGALGILIVAAIIGLVAGRIPLMVPDVALSAAGFVVVILVHAAFWVGLLSIIALLVRKLEAVLSIYVAIWFLTVIAAPVLVEGVARHMTQPPDPLAVFAADRAAIVAARNLEDRLIALHVARHPETAEALLRPKALLITPTNLLVEAEAKRLRAPERRREEQARDRYNRLSTKLAWLSPSLAASMAVDRIAGRNHERQRAFEAQVRAYHTRLQTTFTPLLMRRAELETFMDVERFTFSEPDRVIE
jgi:ABC-2 type transport system permease protein